MSNYEFKKKYTLENRCIEAKRILSKYHDRKPVIVERVWKSGIPELDKHKYLVPLDLTFGQFLNILRRRVALSPETALFMFVGEKLKMPVPSEIISVVYAEEVDIDGFLYLKIGTEETFGN